MPAVDRLNNVLARIKDAAEFAGRSDHVQLVAVSKTFDADAIRPVLKAGHRVFGENRVQESQGKWPRLKAEYPDTELHLIGPLQSNKAADAVALFDVIETIDREKIAKAVAAEISRQGKQPGLLVQVNTGGEEQKAGVSPQETEAFVRRCEDVHGLKISGLMCIPPVSDAPAPHFALIDELCRKLGLPVRSMGMSGDFEIAIGQGATHVRVGSAVFGQRPPFKGNRD